MNRRFLPVPNPRTLLNRHLLKPETVAKVEAMGELACQILDRWVSTSPETVKKLEVEGRLLALVASQIEQEQRARDLQKEIPWPVGDIEARQMLGLPDVPPV